MGGSPLIGDEGAAGWQASILQSAASGPTAIAVEGKGSYHDEMCLWKGLRNMHRTAIVSYHTAWG